PYGIVNAYVLDGGSFTVLNDMTIDDSGSVTYTGGTLTAQSIVLHGAITVGAFVTLTTGSGGLAFDGTTAATLALTADASSAARFVLHGDVAVSGVGTGASIATSAVAGGQVLGAVDLSGLT